MVTAVTEENLQQLRPGDRLKYHGVQWQIDDYSTYSDANDYETAEWLLSSQSGKKYYLLREVDPENPETSVNWYIAEELRYPTLLDSSTQRDLLPVIWDDMQTHREPYSELQVFHRTYQFESETRGSYESTDETSDRITWDYWDATHLWNLALEAWPDGTLAVYSTRKVQPTDFSEIETGKGGLQRSSRSSFRSFELVQTQQSRSIKLAIAWFITILGFLLMMFGV